jgi:hypothetical protein
VRRRERQAHLQSPSRGMESSHAPAWFHEIEPCSRRTWCSSRVLREVKDVSAGDFGVRQDELQGILSSIAVRV